MAQGDPGDWVEMKAPEPNDWIEVHPTSEKYSALEAGVRSAAKTGSYDFAPRIEGAIGAVRDYFENPDIEAMKAGGKLDALKEAYNLRRSMAEDRYKEAATEHPVADFVGMVPGAALAPGPSVTGRAAKFGKAIGQGALDGVGQSRDLTDPEETAKSAAFGGTVGGATHGLLSEVAPVVVRGGGKVGKALGNVAFGVPGEAAEHYMGNAEAVKSAPGLEQTTRRFLDHADQTAGDISAASGRSFNTLRNTGILTDHVGLTHHLNEAAQSLQRGGAYGPEQKGAVNFLNGLSRDVEADAAANGGMLPLDRGKNLVRVLDTKIADASARPGADARVLQELRGARASIDNILKSSSPEYAREMEQLAADTQAYKGMSDNFRTPNGAQNLMKRIMRGRAPMDADNLSRYDEQFGTNFGPDLKNSYTKDAFTRDTTNGSRKTLLGTVVGSAVGAPVVGAFAGNAADKYGGAIYQKILDGSLNLGKFTAPLYNAAKRGQASFAATHALLLKSNPEYRDLIESQLKGATP